MVKATGENLLIEADEFARGNGFISQPVFFLFRAIDPNDVVGLAHASHLFYPFLKFAMLVHVSSNAPMVVRYFAGD
jgi:hypothetical protein